MSAARTPNITPPTTEIAMLSHPPRPVTRKKMPKPTTAASRPVPMTQAPRAGSLFLAIW